MYLNFEYLCKFSGVPKFVTQARILYKYECVSLEVRLFIYSSYCVMHMYSYHILYAYFGLLTEIFLACEKDTNYSTHASSFMS